MSVNIQASKTEKTNTTQPLASLAYQQVSEGSHVHVEPVLDKPGYHPEIFFNKPMRMAVGDDGSELADKTIMVASHFAFLYQSQLSVYAVLPQGSSPSIEREQNIKQLFEPTPGVSTHDYNLGFVYGYGEDAASELNRMGVSSGCDWLFLGCEGKSNFDAFRQGSVAYELILHSPLSLVLVHPQSKTAAYKHILVPFDGTSYALIALRKALDFARLTHAQISVVHVHAPNSFAVNEEIKIEKALELANWQGQNHEYQNVKGHFTDAMAAIGQKEEVDCVMMAAPPHGNESILSHHSHAIAVAQNLKAVLVLLRQ
ncbi:universal stress protein [bacterium]|nr:universal stress protein [bacterium]